MRFPLRLITALAALSSLAFVHASEMSKQPIFIGTYTRDNNGSKGIYSIQLDLETGQLSTPTVAGETQGPSYLALSPDKRFLYAVAESEAMALGFAIDSSKTKLTALNTTDSPKSKAPCHLAVDHTGHTLVVVNYQTGNVASFPIRADGSLGAVASLIQHTGSSVNPERQSTAHAHSATISPDNKYVFVCDLGLDKVFAYKLDAAHSTLAPAEPPFVKTAPGSGPRHFAFAPNGRHAFMVTEMGGTLTAYAYAPAGGLLVARDTESTLPADFRGENTSAAVRVHPTGKFVYASNRGPDTIAVFAFDEASEHLKLIQTIASGGKGPRDFALSPDGRWLISAHQYSNSLCVFKVDPSTGLLTPTPHTAAIPTPVCVLFAN